MEKLALKGGAPVRTQAWPKWPVFDEREEMEVLRVLRSGNWWRHSYGQGVELEEDDATSQSTVAQFQRAFARAHDCHFGICGANGTVTLEIALRAAGIRPGDEVIVPAYTFVATATAPLMVGAVPIFVDINPDTYNLDPLRLEQVITPRSRAVIPVHFGGQPCDMDAINAIAQAHGLVVIEDAAHAHGASYRGMKCGSLAAMGSFSFQNSKNMTAGEGGIITTNDSAYAEMCESLVWAGRRRGEPWYRHYVLASNARMTEFQGAILSVQLSRLEEQNRKRTANARVLDNQLSKIDGIAPLRMLPTTTCCAYHIFLFRYKPEGFYGLPKTEFVRALQAEGMGEIFGGYTTPLYQNPMFLEKNFFGGAYPVDERVYGQQIDYSNFEELCPVSERACASEAVWIPQNMLLTDEEAMVDIARAVRKIQVHARELV
jgi:dTDP-4-amino-4,6-dideoxygalactose transaminase